MNRSIRLLSLLLVLILAACGERPNALPSSGLAEGMFRDTLHVSDLEGGTNIRESGDYLMSLPAGLIQITSGAEIQDSILVFAVHGYASEGYEWITSIIELSHHFGTCYFYRYDWERCPDEVATELVSAINALSISAQPGTRILLFAHSYGGVVGAFAASQLSTGIPAELHLIAAPLAGYPRLMDACDDLRYDNQDRLVIPAWDSRIHVLQHRTVHAQDGAFRDLAVDPQVVNLPFHEIISLPPTMDGHRLGHNWSVSWVVDNYLGKPHGF